MDRLTSMSVFTKAVELGSFAAVADAMAISPQMVAKHVVYLEDRLGTTLLNRTTRRQNLTDVGRAYYERCKQVLSDVEAADMLAQEMRSQPKGIIRVNAPVTFGSFSLAPFVTRYLARYPDVQVDLALNDRFVNPMEESYEVLIRIGEIDDNSMIARPISPYRLIACASPDYIARRGMPEKPSDLEQHDCLAYAYWSPSVPCRWMFTRDGKGEEVQVKGRMRCNDWRTLLHAAKEGYGITLGPENAMRSEIEAGRLVHVLPDYEGPTRPMHVLYSAGRKPTAKVRSFVDALIEEFPAQTKTI